jgi:hypothetical protein
MSSSVDKTSKNPKASSILYCSSIFLEAYTSVSFIKMDDSNRTTWSTMGDNFMANQTDTIPLKG